MIKIDIFSGFLGAGKTTLIRKLIAEAYTGQKIVLIENEFGEIGIDGGFLKDAGVDIHEMNSGCICCSLTGDFRRALKMVADEYNPDRIIIEPSGVGKLSDVAAAVMSSGAENIELGGLTTVVDAGKCKMYMKNFGEFFNNQVETAHTIILSRTQKVKPAKVEEAVALLREKAPDAVIMTADWDELSGKQILEAIDGKDELSEQLEKMIKEHMEEHEHHHHHEDGEECCCGHHHHDHDDEHECEHGHEHEHHHHHEDGEECCCGHHHDHDHEHEHDHEHHHHHHHDHDADEVFTSWGCQTAKYYSQTELEEILEELENAINYGIVLRAKGIVQSSEGGWLHFDYTPGEAEVRKGEASATGLLCVIGSGLKEDAVKELFGVN